MKKPEGEPLLSVRPRETEVVSLVIPKDTLAPLRQVFAQREMSEQALLKFSIGQGLRQDLARLFGDRVPTTTAHVLGRHLQSDEAVAAIMCEIREEAVRSTGGEAQERPGGKRFARACADGLTLPVLVCENPVWRRWARWGGRTGGATLPPTPLDHAK